MIISTSSRLGEVKPYYFATKLAEIAEMNRSGEQVINMGIGSPDLAPPPEVMNELIRASTLPRANQYQSYRGLPELRSAFANHYHRHLGVDIDANKEILPLIGSKEGIMHIAMTFLEAGDEALIPNPGYPSYRVTTELAGATPVYYELSEEGGWLPDIDALVQTDLSRVKIMWINYPNMPTGARASREFFGHLIEFARKNEILICHDNPYNYILNDQPLSLLSLPGSMECCIELCSLSKAYNMAGWRVGAVLGSQGYIDAIMRFKSNMDSGMYLPVQMAAAKALDLNDDWFEEINAIYRERRNEVYKIFDLLDCTYKRDGAGLFVWAKAPDYIADVPSWVDEMLHVSRTFITPGFIFGDRGERYLRIALCSPIEVYREAFSRLETRFVKSIAEV
ncbi:MAG: aminotransferase class I/II-fold pyridoxal phosphate-dependent enzyme [Bacteroidota bacterium]